jgi:hypothetical protein
MTEREHKLPIDVKDLYNTLVDTRNLEINLFWQRSNYFLVLNTGIAFGFFNLLRGKFAVIFAVMGLLASFLWFCVCLGSKFWQSRWEHRLLEFEKEHLPGLDFFGASPERIRTDAQESLALDDRPWLQRHVYRLVLCKPSVSYSMILLSALFALGWVSFIAVFVVLGKSPIG